MNAQDYSLSSMSGETSVGYGWIVEGLDQEDFWGNGYDDFSQWFDDIVEVRIEAIPYNPEEMTKQEYENFIEQVRQNITAEEKQYVINFLADFVYKDVYEMDEVFSPDEVYMTSKSIRELNDSHNGMRQEGEERFWVEFRTQFAYQYVTIDESVEGAEKKSYMGWKLEESKDGYSTYVRKIGKLVEITW